MLLGGARARYVRPSHFEFTEVSRLPSSARALNNQARSNEVTKRTTKTCTEFISRTKARPAYSQIKLFDTLLNLLPKAWSRFSSQLL